MSAITRKCVTGFLTGFHNRFVLKIPHRLTALFLRQSPLLATSTLNVRGTNHFSTPLLTRHRVNNLVDLSRFSARNIEAKLFSRNITFPHDMENEQLIRLIEKMASDRDTESILYVIQLLHEGKHFLYIDRNFPWDNIIRDAVIETREVEFIKDILPHLSKKALQEPDFFN